MANDQNSPKSSENKEKSEEHDRITEEDTTKTDGAAPAESLEAAEDGPTPADGDAVLVVEEDAEVDAGSESQGVPGAITDIERAEQPAPVAAEPVAAAPSGPSTFGLVFGGLVAGAIGFLVATFAVPEWAPNPPADPNAALEAALEAERARVDDLVEQIGALGTAPAAEVDLSSVTGEIEALSARIEALAADMSATTARLEEVEGSVLAPAAAPEINFDAEMDEIRAELEAAAAAARAEVEAAQTRAAEVEAEAARAAEAAMQRAALAEVSAALESGSPFSDALSRIPDAPEALVSVATQGVPTLSALRADFPDAARAALRQVQSVPGDAPATERLTAFLRQQTNARSLSPREGDDPDAVLSRVEAALNSGDLSVALDELAALPEGAQSAMGAWIERAEVRASAASAAQSLADALN